MAGVRRGCGEDGRTRGACGCSGPARTTRTLGVMALIQVFSPQSEPELIVVKSLLEAHDIPVFVHGRHFGSLLPGLQLGNANMQVIMVPEERADDARELLAGFRRDSIPSSHRGDHDA